MRATSASARALVLVNRRARRGGERIGEAVARLRALGVDLVEASVTGPEPPAEIIRRYGREVDRVIVAGGDGTINRALEGLLESGLPLGVLPLGTANNLARTLGIPTELDAACAVAARGEPRSVDVGRVNQRPFLTTASLGLSVAITEQLSGEAKRRWGRLAYAVVAARVLVRARPFTAEIVWPEGRLRTRTVQIVVGNGRYYGAALAVAEDATIRDRQLDAYSLEIRHWWELVRLAPALKRGSHGARPAVQTVRAREMDVLTTVPHRIDVDGELGPSTPAHFAVLPGALRVLCPGSAERKAAA
ncbi:MAG TPA: lipid kinase [Gemmatimonadales bacterium]|nr:lipid kinase [Gemmatimonadales bacterium]